MDRPTDQPWQPGHESNRTPDTGSEKSGGLSAREAATALGLNERTIRRAIARGDLPATKHGGSFRITEAALTQFRARAPAMAPLRPQPGHSSPRLVSLLPRVTEVADPPVNLTSFVGRDAILDQDLAQLRRDDVRLLTLTGPGGVGKTRLGIEIGHRLRTELADGVCFVDLASLADDTLVLPAIGRAVGLGEDVARPWPARLIAALRDQNLLLVLDGFEQVVAGAVAVGDLLGGCPDVKALVTSRTILRLSAEHEFTVPPLALPEASAHVTVEQILESEAVRLFVERARTTDPSFAVTDATAPLLAVACARLEGLPLAIELAAARTKVLPPPEPLRRLDRRLEVLTVGARDRPPRHRTMRDAIAWSYDLLPPPAQALFRRMGIFVGGFTLGAAETVGKGAATADERAILDALSLLIDQSLVLRDPALPAAGSPRFAMLDTIREFALERIEDCGEGEEARRVHAAYFVALADEHERTAWLPAPIGLLARFEADLPNLRAALAWLVATGQAEPALRLTGALRWFWTSRGYLREGRDWLERAHALDGSAGHAVRARAATALAQITFYQGDERRARGLYEVGLTEYLAAGDPFGTAFALSALGALDIYDGDEASAVPRLTEALTLVERVSDAGLAASLAASITSNLGMAAYGQGDLSSAATWFQDALARYRVLNYWGGIVSNLHVTGIVAGERGEQVEALAHFSAALTIATENGGERGVGSIIEGVAGLVALGGAPEQAARFHGSAAALRERVGNPNRYPIVHASYQRGVDAARRALGEEGFAVAWAAGHAMPLDAIFAEMSALRMPAPVSYLAQRYALTPREHEILVFLADRRTNREIGDALSISHRTVQRHVTNILTKLGVDSRRAAGEIAARERAHAPGIESRP